MAGGRLSLQPAVTAISVALGEGGEAARKEPWEILHSETFGSNPEAFLSLLRWTYLTDSKTMLITSG